MTEGSERRGRPALQRALRRAYARLGPRYPDVAVVGQLQLVYPIVLFNLGMLALYVEMSAGEFLGLAVSAVAGFFLYNFVYARVARRRLEPVRRWLAGDRDRVATLSAWGVCASFPREMGRREWKADLGVFGYGGLGLWAVPRRRSPSGRTWRSRGRPSRCRSSRPSAPR